jgi:FMN phosphatase YigB (HAD superfamily)
VLDFTCYCPGVPLLLVDLDNTLIDRAGAFARWAHEFVSVQHGSLVDVQWHRRRRQRGTTWHLAAPRPPVDTQRIPALRYG